MLQPQLPRGFKRATERDKQRVRESQPKLPFASLSPRGYISFNEPVAIFLRGGRAQVNEAIGVAFNEEDNILAVWPIRLYTKAPWTMKLTSVGPRKEHATAGFKVLAKLWSVPLTKRRYACEIDVARNIVFVNLNRPL